MVTTGKEFYVIPGLPLTESHVLVTCIMGQTLRALLVTVVGGPDLFCANLRRSRVGLTFGIRL